MKELSPNDVYLTDPDRAGSGLAGMLTSARWTFYPQVFLVVFRAACLARRGKYDGEAWRRSSVEILRACENVGMRFEVTGLDQIRELKGPAVFIGNHMSTLETFVLPGIIRGFRPVTFVVKESLITYPIFGHVMSARRPVVVGRKNPREDLATVLKEGAARLKQGISLVIFPQSTRSSSFDPGKFNSLGAKLAARVEVPVVPVAVKTDAWGTGRRFKDFGPVDPAKPVHIAFGHPVEPDAKGAVVHEVVTKFIISHLKNWGAVLADQNG